MSQRCVEKKSRDFQEGQEGRAAATWGRWRVETRWVDSVRMGLFVVQDTSAAGGDRGTADDLHPPAGREGLFHQSSDIKDSATVQIYSVKCASVPLKSVFALWSEIVDVGLEMQFEDVVLMDVFRLWWDGDWVAQQREAGQRIIILVCKYKVWLISSGR